MRSTRSSVDGEERRRRRLLLVLFLGVLMGALDIAIVGPALPAIRQSFGVDDRGIGWIFSVYVLFNLIGILFMSKLSDRLGRRPVYLLDVAAFALGSVVVASAPSFGALLVGRGLQGVAAGGLWPVASAVIGESFPPERRGRSLGLIGAVWGLAFLLGPLLGGLFLMLSWRWLFIINIPFAFIVFVLSLRALPRSKPAEPRPFDLPGMATLAIMLAAFAMGINQIQSNDFPATLISMRVLPFLLVALAAVPVLVLFERRAEDPVLHPVLFRNRQLVLASLLSLGAGFSEGSLVFVPAFTVAVFRVSVSTASFLLLAPVIAVAIFAPLWGRLIDRAGSRLVISIGVAFSIVGLLVAGFLGKSFVAYLCAGVAIGLGISSLLGAPIRYIMLHEAPKEFRTVAQGLISVFTSVGQMTSGALVGGLAASFGGGSDGYLISYRILGFLFIVFLLAAAGLRSRSSEGTRVAQSERESAGQG